MPPAMAEISGVVHGLTEFGRELLQRVVARKLQPGENVNESRCGCDEKKLVEKCWKKNPVLGNKMIVSCDSETCEVKLMM